MINNRTKRHNRKVIIINRDPIFMQYDLVLSANKWFLQNVLINLFSRTMKLKNIYILWWFRR